MKPGHAPISPQNVVPCWHAPAVDIGTFWNIIETGRASPDRTGLSRIPDRPPGHPHRAGHPGVPRALREDTRSLYRYDLWAAACLIGGGCSDDGFIDFRAWLIAQGHDWYQKAAASSDSLAGHPAVASAGHPRHGNPLFYEEADYAASRAFQRVSSDERAFWDALEARGPGDRLAVVDEDFNFDDDQEMRRRLPRSSACCLGSSPGSEQD